MDYYWMCRQEEGLQSPPSKPATLALQSRVLTSLPASAYNAHGFVAYIFYPPVYLTGPTMTYNCWISHIASPQKSYNLMDKFKYLARWFFVFMLIEVGSHYIHIWAVARDASWESYEAWQTAVLGYVMLNWLWLKFTAMWRLARFFVLLDDVECWENMTRCMTNNRSFQVFWRAWHQSLNKWAVRYIYIPLGGNRTKLWNVFFVMGFMALWHDIELHLFVWGLGVAVVLVPEIMAEAVWRSPRTAALRSTPILGHTVKGLACAANAFLMSVLNLIGFGVGTHTVWVYVVTIATTPSFLATTAFWFFCTVSFQMRYDEARDARERRNAGVDDELRNVVTGNKVGPRPD
eukprot:NODE_2200_length_1115_cov_61.440283_g2182_i0.p1 GENE.NODE_2200_length_1115_cov_61.440283_g2182_i0~~NODE_2200_length_1115_cov_61.440283_g2182_i0.p1  ORF type:complete len:364 (-),score=65.51 NODE_2200_length_1115_cov_61.440283_g2182_i0:24-1064(-)